MTRMEIYFCIVIVYQSGNEPTANIDKNKKKNRKQYFFTYFCIKRKRKLLVKCLLC